LRDAITFAGYVEKFGLPAARVTSARDVKVSLRG